MGILQLPPLLDYIPIIQKTTFTLVVDDFGVKYHNTTDALHIINSLKEQYSITIDWIGKLYIGITLHWNYKKGLLDLSMPGYIEQDFNKFTHPPPRRSQHSPHASIPPTFGKEQQLTSLPNTLPFIDESGIRHVQEVVGTLLYHARCVNSHILHNLNTIG